MSNLIPHPELPWRYIDQESGLICPWYTGPCLKWLKTRLLVDLRVFEYGSGMSTFWWRKNASVVDSVDDNKEWADKMSVCHRTNEKEYCNRPVEIGRKYDIIVIDGVFRDECTEFALKAIKPGGYIIIDNYHQATTDMPESFWVKTDELLKNYPRVVFKEPEHQDWKTAAWQII